MLWNNSYYGCYRTRTFTDIWDNAQDFVDEFCESPFSEIVETSPGVYSAPCVSTDNLTKLFYLLYARYGNSHIAPSDENRFKYRLFSIINEYGPAWQRKLGIQKTLRDLTEAELMNAGQDIFNHAYNPSTAPSTDIIDNINEQNTSRRTRSKTDAYAYLYSLLRSDITSEFLREFRKLFLIVVAPERPLWYVSWTDDDLTNEPDEEDI